MRRFCITSLNYFWSIKLSTVIENLNYTKEERLEWRLNENIVVHCLASLMGVEDIYYTKNPEEKKAQRERLGESPANAKEMIKAETGLERLDKLFGSISKAKHESDIITYFQERK